MKFFDCVVIGAGAAGLMCAAIAGKRGRKVLLVDHAKAVGEKIRISGGGRCNFTNLFVSEKNFISKNPHFCVSALKRFTSQDFINLIKKHQIAFHEKTLGQLFCDISSKQIIKMLLDECALGNVEISLESKVSDIKKTADFFELKIKNYLINCQSLVIATGGLSIPKMGATGFGYDVARQFGLKIIQPIPALVPLTFAENLLSETKSLSGVAVDAIVSCKKISFREAILFTHRGISGPAILQISSYLKRGEKIVINLVPEVDIFSRLQEEKKLKPKQELQSFIAQFLPKSLANYLSIKANHLGNLADLSNQKIKEIADSINRWNLETNDTEGFAKAEVTSGGVDTNEISSKTFESKKVSNLFFIGEVLDVTGWLGGFNFQWAWASGKAAGEYV
ncbi:MAG: NAD(P)/FAD-dependent oxidoreductase [Proteobacteria bacterium]|nr:NAD(P)/FAD-dependent oxidoreductase [Pseudomonadota bacterium]